MSDETTQQPPRMWAWVLIYIALLALAMAAQVLQPHGVLAVTLYKAHLMALGGWGGYWLDRALFPYDRPHQYLESDEPAAASNVGSEQDGQVMQVASASFGHAMLRRAIIVAGCLVCVGLGA